jgi:hypothetical protein
MEKEELEVGGRRVRLRAEGDLAARGPEGGNAGIIPNVRLDEVDSFYLTKSGEHFWRILWGELIWGVRDQHLLSKATDSIEI